MTASDAPGRRSTASSLQYIGAALLAALLCVAPIVYAHRESPRTLVSAHGLLHTAIAQRIAATSLLDAPPENPFFAGARVPYYWFFQYCGARLGGLFGVHPLYTFEWMILGAVCVAWLAAASLGHRLYGGIAPGLAVGVLVFAGTNPFGFAILLGKVALRGTAPFHDDPNHLWGIAHPVLSAARLNDPFDLYGPPINFFFNVTARPLGLVSLLVAALCLLAWMQRGSSTVWLGLVISIGLSTAFSLLIGAAGAVTLAAGLVLAAWLPSEVMTSRALLWRRRALWACGALALGTLLAAPTYVHLLFGEADRGMRIDLSLSAVIRSTASAGLIVALAAVGVLLQRGEERRYLLAVFLAGTALVGVGTLVQLPVANECNLFQAGALLLAIPAVGSFVPAPNWSRVRARLTWLLFVGVFVPTPILVMGAYLHRAPVALTFTAQRLDRTPADSSLAHLYAWVRDKTAPDAVFVLDPGPPFTAAVGNMPEFPALTQRVIFTSYLSSYMVVPHHDKDVRHQIARLLLAGQPLSDSQSEYLRTMGRPLYLVAHSSDGTMLPPALQERFGMPVFHDSDVAVFSIDPSRTRQASGTTDVLPLQN